jgi:tRNA-binding EMAP/Myf-like protein
VVANLETAKLRGLESEGMLLAASDDGRVIILTPEKSVAAGAKVS